MTLRVIDNTTRQQIINQALNPSYYPINLNTDSDILHQSYPIQMRGIAFDVAERNQYQSTGIEPQDHAPPGSPRSSSMIVSSITIPSITTITPTLTLAVAIRRRLPPLKRRPEESLRHTHHMTQRGMGHKVTEQGGIISEAAFHLSTTPMGTFLMLLGMVSMRGANLGLAHGPRLTRALGLDRPSQPCPMQPPLPKQMSTQCTRPRLASHRLSQLACWRRVVETTATC